MRDSGVGIPEHSEQIVFGPFKQEACPDNRDYGGTGLGMSISREILEVLGGTIDYTSEVGVGTTFAIGLNLYIDTEETSEQGVQDSDPALIYAAE